MSAFVRLHTSLALFSLVLFEGVYSHTTLPRRSITRLLRNDSATPKQSALTALYLSRRGPSLPFPQLVGQHKSRRLCVGNRYPAVIRDPDTARYLSDAPFPRPGLQADRARTVSLMLSLRSHSAAVVHFKGSGVIMGEFPADVLSGKAWIDNSSRNGLMVVLKTMLYPKQRKMRSTCSGFSLIVYLEALFGLTLNVLI